MAEPQKKEPSRLEKFAAKAAEARAQQPSVGAELAATFRGGREDAWNKLIPAFPEQQYTREQGAPGSPTSQIITEDLKNKEVDKATDRIEPPKTPQKNKDRGVEMG